MPSILGVTARIAAIIALAEALTVWLRDTLGPDLWLPQNMLLDSLLLIALSTPPIFILGRETLCGDGLAREKIAAMARKISAAITAPIDCGGLRLQVGCSMGVNLLGAQRTTVDQALREADSAMYHAKRHAPGGVVFADAIDTLGHGIAPIGIDTIDREHREIDALLEEGMAVTAGQVAYARRRSVVWCGPWPGTRARAA